MSCNGVGALKCQCLCQLPKHAASIQSKITGTSAGAGFKCKRILFLLSVYLALCDIEGIFKQTLKHLNFSPLTLVPLKKTASPIKNMMSCHCRHSHTSNDRQQSCVCNNGKMREIASWHAGQSVLTQQVNRGKALEETTVSFKTKTQSTHWPGIIEAGMQKG